MSNCAKSNKQSSKTHNFSFSSSTSCGPASLRFGLVTPTIVSPRAVDRTHPSLGQSILGRTGPGSGTYLQLNVSVFDGYRRTAVWLVRYVHEETHVYFTLSLVNFERSSIACTLLRVSSQQSALGRYSLSMRKTRDFFARVMHDVTFTYVQDDLYPLQVGQHTPRGGFGRAHHNTSH